MWDVVYILTHKFEIRAWNFNMFVLCMFVALAPCALIPSTIPRIDLISKRKSGKLTQASVVCFAVGVYLPFAIFFIDHAAGRFLFYFCDDLQDAVCFMSFFGGRERIISYGDDNSNPTSSDKRYPLLRWNNNDI